jgi:peptidoglycan/xylan/chitin deacetylase (PgdA/CDA1 family)
MRLKYLLFITEQLIKIKLPKLDKTSVILKYKNFLVTFLVIFLTLNTTNKKDIYTKNPELQKMFKYAPVQEFAKLPVHPWTQNITLYDQIYLQSKNDANAYKYLVMDYFLKRNEFQNSKALPDFKTIQAKNEKVLMLIRAVKPDCNVLKCVAITYDDGPGEFTAGILSELDKYGAKGTFYVLGSLVGVHPELIKQMDSNGHEVANHTWSHPNLAQSSTQKIQQEIANTDITIQKIIQKPAHNMRPPYGAINTNVLKSLTKHPVIMWSVDTSDWQHKDVQKTIQIATTNIKPGDIILLHDIHASTGSASPAIIKSLTDQGFLLVTVSELLDNGVKPKPAQIVKSQADVIITKTANTK